MSDFGRVRMLHVDCDIDIASRPAFEKALNDLEDERPLIVDLSCCPYLDSTGLTALVRRHSVGSIMAIVVPRGSLVARVFALTQMERVLNIFQSLDLAIVALTPETP